MKMKLTMLAVLFSTTTAFAGDITPMHEMQESLGKAPGAADILKFTCGTLEGITVDHAAVTVNDLAPVQKPVVNVQIAPWNGTACGEFSDAEQDAIDADGIPSEHLELAMPTEGGEYCLKISKTPGKQNGAPGSATAKGPEIYEIDTHCGQEGSVDHAPSTLDAVIQNQ